MHELQKKFFDRRIKSDDLRNDNLLLGTSQSVCVWGGGGFEDQKKRGVGQEQ